MAPKGAVADSGRATELKIREMTADMSQRPASKANAFTF